MMKTDNTENAIVFPDDEDRLTPQAIFNEIVKAAQNHWCPMDPIPTAFQRMGHVKAWRGERSLLATLSYEPKPESESDRGNIGLRAIVADHVQVTPDKFHYMIYRATKTYRKSKAIYDENLQSIITESNVNPPMVKEEIPMVIHSVFTDFSHLLNDDCLRSALSISKARLLGTPLDIWDRD